MSNIRGLLLSAIATVTVGIATYQYYKQQYHTSHNTNTSTDKEATTGMDKEKEKEEQKKNKDEIVSTSTSSSTSSSSSFITTEYHLSPGIISCASLAQLLQQQQQQQQQQHQQQHGQLIVLDASWFLPQAQRDPEMEFLTYHIRTSHFWNIDTIADTSSGYLPHMLPFTSVFENACYQVGIRSVEDRIVCYDTSGAFCASARLWWTFRCFGWPADHIHVLHGGMQEFASSYPEWIENTIPRTISQQESQQRLGRWQPRFISSWYRSKKDVLASLSTSSSSSSSPPEILLDVRDRNRFDKIDGEPRPIKYRGHIPGAKHLFHGSLITLSTQQQQLKSRAEMEALFKSSLGFSVSCPPFPAPIVVSYCGSGVTAATATWVMSLLGYPEDAISLYDGSWAEWGNDDHVPIE